MNIDKLRADYRACVKLADETDSKSETATLQREAAVLLRQLRGECPHEQAVILRSYYEDDSDPCNGWSCVPETRRCLCCGLQEDGTPDEPFKILTREPIARFEYDAPSQIKSPLSHLLAELVELAIAKGYPVVGRLR